MLDPSVPTPLCRIADDVFVKCDFLHPGRSHKARVARMLIDEAERRGEIAPGDGQVLLERTGGNLGIALAIEARIRGYDLTLVTDPGYSNIKKDIARRLGAHVIDRGVSYPECTSNGSVIEILTNEPGSGYFYLNQFANPANPLAHERGTGAEILRQLTSHGVGQSATIVLIAGLGTGATMAGVSGTLRSWYERVRLFAVQPSSCDVLAGRYADHALQGIAVGEAPPFINVSDLDAVISVSDSAAGQARQDLLKRYRFLVGPSSAANYAALRSARQHQVALNDDNVIYVTILYDRGEDYE